MDTAIEMDSWLTEGERHEVSEYMKLCQIEAEQFISAFINKKKIQKEILACMEGQVGLKAFLEEKKQKESEVAFWLAEKLQIYKKEKVAESLDWFGGVEVDISSFLEKKKQQGACARSERQEALRQTTLATISEKFQYREQRDAEVLAEDEKQMKKEWSAIMAPSMPENRRSEFEDMHKRRRMLEENLERQKKARKDMETFVETTKTKFMALYEQQSKEAKARMIKETENDISAFTWREQLKVDEWAGKLKKESAALISKYITEKQGEANQFASKMARQSDLLFVQQGEEVNKEIRIGLQADLPVP